MVNSCTSDYYCCAPPPPPSRVAVFRERKSRYLLWKMCRFTSLRFSLFIGEVDFQELKGWLGIVYVSETWLCAAVRSEYYRALLYNYTTQQAYRTTATPPSVCPSVITCAWQVNVRTTLGPAAVPLSVIVSLAVPRLVVGVVNPEGLTFTGSAETAPRGRPLSPSTDVVVTANVELRSIAGSSGGGGGGTSPLRFPLTEVGETREMFIRIRNPADVPVLVQLAAAEGESVVWTPSRQKPEAGADGSADVSLATTLQPFVKQGLVREAGALAAFHVRVGGFAPVVLPAGGTSTIGPIRFAPARDGVFSAYVYLKNDLTHLEPVLLEGEAGSGVLAVRPWGQAGQEGKNVGPGASVSAAVRDSGAAITREVVDGEKEEATQFPVDFRSWARWPPTTEPVTKRWVLSNEGTVPLIVRDVGVRKVGGSRWGWGWVGGRDDDDDGALARTLRWIFFGRAVSRQGSASARPGWGGAVAAATAAASAAVAGSTPTVVCADGGFRVVGETCEGQWRPKTLNPGQEMELTVEYSAAHCNPVGRTLDIMSSAGNASIPMVASAAGGPSTIAACRSARRAAAAAGKGKGKGKENTRSHEGEGGGRDERWRRAWLLIKLALLLGVLYGGGAVLGAGPDLAPLTGWVRRLQARIAGCVTAASHGCGGYSVSVEVRASAAVVVSSPTTPASPSPSPLDSSSSSSPSASSSCGDGSVSSEPERAEGTTTVVLPRSSSACPVDPYSGCSPLALKQHDRDDAERSSNGNQDSCKEREAPPLNGKRDTLAQPELLIAEAWVSSGDGVVALAGGDSAQGTVVPEVVDKGVCPAVAVVAGSPNKTAEVAGGTGGDDEQVLTSTTSVEILTSPGRASRPNRQQPIPSSCREKERRERSEPGQQITTELQNGNVGGSGSGSGGVGGDQRPLPPAATDSAGQPVQRSPSLGGTSSPAPSWSIVGGAGNADHGVAGGPPPGLSPRYEAAASPQPRRDVGRALPGMGAANCSQHGGGNRGPRKGAPHQQQQRWPGRSARGATHPHSQGPARSPRAGMRNIPNERMSPSSSRYSPGVDSPNPPALPSPAASMVASPESAGSHGGRHYYHQRSAARHGGSGQLTRHGGAGAGAQRQSGGFRSQGGGHNNGISGYAVKSPSLPVQHAPGAAQSRWGQEQGSHHRHASVPPLALSTTPQPGVAPEAGNPPGARLFHRPSTGWIADNVPRNPGALPVATPAGIAAINTHASPPFGPIGSQRVRSTSAAGAGDNRDGQRPTGAGAAAVAGRRMPPGLSPRGQHLNSYLPLATVPSSRATAASTFTTPGAAAQAEWSDNMETFATASAVAAGVLSTDDVGAVDVAGRLARTPGGGVADSWSGYPLDTAEAAGPGGGDRHGRWFPAHSPSGHSPPHGEIQRAAPSSSPTTRFGEGLSFEGATALDLQQQSDVGRGVVGASSGGGGGGGGSRAAGGSRLGHYMSAAGGKADPAPTQHGHGSRKQPEESAAATFGSSYGAAPPPFLAASGARNAGGFFGFMGDGDDN